jgi:predicted RNase H-like nuclease (RuvC/YqgF family)
LPIHPPLSNIQLVSESYSLKKRLTAWRDDLERYREIEEVLPKFNEEGNPVIIEEGSKTRASNAPTLEDLTRRLEKLTAENKKLRAKVRDKKTKGSSSSSEKEDSSFEEEVSKKGKKGRINLDKPSYNSMSFNYNNMSFIPIGKAPYFDGTSYN